MPKITIGTMIAGLMQYILIMGIFLPAATGCVNVSPLNVVCATPPSFANASTALVSWTNTTLSSSVIHNFTSQVQSNTIGIPSQTNNPAYTIGAFLYFGLGAFLTDLLNVPIIMYKIFSFSISYIGVLGVVALAGVSAISTGLAGYMTWLLGVKFVSFLQKMVVEET